MKNMKILILADARSPHTIAVANNLAATGIDIQLLSLTPPTAGFSEEVVVHSLMLETSPTIKNYDLAVSLAQKLIDEWQPDYVNSHYTTIYGRIASYLKGCPHIASVWGSDILVRPKRSQIDAAVVRRALSSASGIFATSITLAKAARSYSSAPIFVTPFGSEAANNREYQSRKFVTGTDPSKPVVLTCAKSLRPYYGHDTAIATVAHLKSQGFYTRLRLAGDGPLEEALKKQAAKAGVLSHIEFLGNIDRLAIHKFHSSGHIGIYPSRDEAFGVSIVECLSNGVPVVASNIGGIPEILNATDAGQMRTPGDVTGFGNAIRHFMRDRRRYGAHCEAARSRGLDFSWDNMIHFFLAALKTLKNESPASLVNISFPGPNAIERAREKGLCIFHYPYTTNEHSNGARIVRITAMRQALAEKMNLIEATGYRTDRRIVLSLIRFYDYFSVRPKFIYAESHTSPYLSFASWRNFDWRFSEYRFLRTITRMGVPLIWYLRDAHVLFPFFARVVGIAETLKRRLLFKLDLLNVGRKAQAIGVPSNKFAKLLPKPLRMKSFALPPGTDITKGGYRQKDRIANIRKGKLRIMYAGGIGALYDNFPFLAACKALNELDFDIYLGFYCRPKEYAQYRADLVGFWVPRKMVLFHADSDRIHKEAVSYNLGAMAVRPSKYLGVAAPLKCYSYLTAGLPILCTRSIGFADTVRSEDIGWTTSGSVIDIALSLIEILQNPSTYETRALNAHRYKMEQSWGARVDEISQLAEGKALEDPDRHLHSLGLDNPQRQVELEPPALADLVEYCRILQDEVDEISRRHFGNFPVSNTDSELKSILPNQFYSTEPN